MRRQRALFLIIFGVGLLLAGGTLFLALFMPSGTEANDLPALLYRLALRDVPHQDDAPKNGRAVVVDLEGMTLSLVENGEEIAEIPILSRGRPGTPWETPSGTYAVKLKEPEHFSSIGRVWMPWSMQIYGNYFIHGWPVYPDGTEVAEGYSGGCVRLSTPNAKRVYEFASRGTPVVIRGGTAVRSSDEFRYYLRGGGGTPSVAARAVFVADIETGQVLWERGAEEVLPLRAASVLMTGLVALETVNQYKIVRMGELLVGKGTLRKHKSGAPDELAIGALLYPLLFDGSDIAAQAFAKEHGVKNFVAAMNEKAQAIGMTDTIFVQPGTFDANTGTARDLFMLLRAVAERKRYLLDVSLTPERLLVDEDGADRFRWKNKNPLVAAGDIAYRGGILAKGEGGGPGVFMGLVSLPLGEFAERDIAIVLLEAPDPEADIATIRKFISERFFWGPPTKESVVAERGESLREVITEFFDLDVLKKELYGNTAPAG